MSEQEKKKGIFHLVLGALAIWRYPWWAILLIVLFGAGGVFYTFYDWTKTPSSTTAKEYEVPPNFSLQVRAVFTPPFPVELPTGLYVEIKNTTKWSVPNLRVVLDTTAARIQSCEIKTAADQSASSTKSTDSTVSVSVYKLLPGDRLEIYCLTDDIRKVTVSMNAIGETGLSLVSQQNTFRRSSTIQSESYGPTFWGFLKFLFGALLLGLTACIIYVLAMIAGRIGEGL